LPELAASAHILPPMRAAAVSVIVAALLLGAVAASAHAQGKAQTSVSVDWQAVRDEDVERCGLSRLRAGTLERLVGEGYAIVERADDSGVRVSVASVPAGLRLRVEGGGVLREETLEAGQCDATFALDVISRIAERVDELASVQRAVPRDPVPGAPAQPAPSEPPGVSAQAPPSAEADHEREHAAVQAAFDFTLRANESPSYQLGGGASVRARLSHGWESGARIELTAHPGGDVTVLEAMLAPFVALQPDLPGVGAYLEVGPILHLASSDARSVRELDLALAVGPQLVAGHLLAQLLVYGRLRSLAHRVGDEIAFDTGRVGLTLRIGAQLSDR
jgi:hypothetical protein